MRGVVATGGAGLLVALGVLVVIGRAERHALTPRPSTPASPPTTTTPPAPLAARIRVGRGVAAVAVGLVWFGWTRGRLPRPPGSPCRPAQRPWRPSVGWSGQSTSPAGGSCGWTPPVH